eukprot:1866222-Rhodomonas_salina.1
MSWFRREKGNKKEKESLLLEDESMPGGYDNRSKQSRMIDKIAGKDRTGVTSYIIRNAERDGSTLPKAIRSDDRATAIASGFAKKMAVGVIVDTVSGVPYIAQTVGLAKQ